MNVRLSKSNIFADPSEVSLIVDRFSKDLRKELGILIKSVVWFGSALKRKKFLGKRSVREEILFGSDIDVLIVFDDLVNVVSPEVITAYRIITEKTAANVSRRLHITTMQLTKFWDYALKGDPILINILKDGEALFDDGCFGVAKNLLSSKKITPSIETVNIYLGKAPMSINNANYNVMQAMLDLYWAVFDAAHSALLHVGFVPQNPDAVVSSFKEHIITPGLMPYKYLSVLAEFMNLGKMLLHREIKHIRGDSMDVHKAEAKEFISAVERVIYNRG